MTNNINDVLYSVDTDGNKLGLSNELPISIIIPPPVSSEKPCTSMIRCLDFGNNRTERHRLTVLFCELVGSADLATRLLPNDVIETVKTYHHLFHAIVSRNDGAIAFHVGEGVTAYFGYLCSRSDDAERAIFAGLDLVANLDWLRGPLPASLGSRLGIRVGIASGIVVIEGVVDNSAIVTTPIAIGAPINLAARLQTIAETNTVVVAEGTRAMLPNRFVFNDLGWHRFGGFSEPQRGWQVAYKVSENIK